MVGHELRAPLAAVKGSAATLLRAEGPLDAAEQRQFHRIIDAQADHMARLVGDLLDAGQIDAGTLTVDPRPVAVAALVERARTAFLAGPARRPLRVELPAGLPPVLADGARVAQVLHNLFANAARYSPASAPIHVGAAPDGIEVAVSVTDEGPGLPPERLPELFRSYADAARGGDRGRFGLGLAILQGHRGGARRPHPRGQRRARSRRPVHVHPAGGAPGGARGPAGASPVPAERERESILVVDDDPETLRYVRRALAGAGYATLATGDPGEAEDLVRSGRPRLVLLDLVLPGADGLELMETVFQPAGLPVIFISAYGGDEQVARALEHGAADYIVKPFSGDGADRAGARRPPPPQRAGAVRARRPRHRLRRRRVTVGGRPVRLTPTEYDLLRVLSLNAGRIVTHASLLHQLWPDGGTDAAPVRDFARRLRRKLGDDPARPPTSPTNGASATACPRGTRSSTLPPRRGLGREQIGFRRFGRERSAGAQGAMGSSAPACRQISPRAAMLTVSVRDTTMWSTSRTSISPRRSRVRHVTACRSRSARPCPTGGCDSRSARSRCA